jgi:hypothetical protein
VKNSSSTEWTAREGRKFAFPVGTAFFVLAAVLWWRDHQTPMRVMLALGGTLWVLGAIVPGKLGPIYRGWMAMALAISKVTTPIFMGIVYFLVLTPTGLVMRLLGRQPMRHDLEGNGFWKPMEGREPGDLRRQF